MDAAGAPLERRVTIVNPKGLHARAAARFVKTAEVFDAQVQVMRDDMAAGGTSILGLMLLAAGIGTGLTLRAEGPEAEAALDALVRLVESGFGET
jgi:phosphocarrier protein